MEDTKTEIKAGSYRLEDTEIEVAANLPVLCDWTTNIDVSWGLDTAVGFLGWRPDPFDLQKNVPVGKRILFRLKDKMSGINIDTVWVKINNQTFRKADPQFKYVGERREYLISARPDENWEYGQEVNVEVYAEDLAGNPGLAVEIL